MSALPQKSLSLPPLPYELHELEPVISKEIMEVHYLKHHAGYVNNLVKLLASLKEAQDAADYKKILALQSALSFNGGGHLNHSLFWENLFPQKKGGGVLADGQLKKLIVETFGSFERFVERMSAETVSVQGSGWGWLCLSGKNLCIASTKNHKLPGSKTPLLCIDVWEHAYYLQYKNARADFVKNIWSIINWNVVEKRLTASA